MIDYSKNTENEHFQMAGRMQTIVFVIEFYRSIYIYSWVYRAIYRATQGTICRTYSIYINIDI